MTNDISTLQTSAINFQKDLRFLPYAVLAQVLGVLGFNMLPGVQNKDVITEYQRKRGVAKPYSMGVVDNSDLGKAKDRTLQVELAYASIKDNIQQYKQTVVGPDQLLDKNKTKQDPWQLVILTANVRTFAEDIIDALFPAARNTADKSPMGLFDGIDTKIDQEIASGDISLGNGNIISTGAINKPVDNNDTDAYDQLLEFWRAAHPLLRGANTLMKMPVGILDAYQSAYFNKFKSKPQVDAYSRITLDGSGDKCKLVGASCMGIGQRIQLEVPGNVDFGMDTLGDEAFVQVRWPYEDPNLVQFWIQASFGTRIRSIHPKSFQINDGSPIANALSGDYIS